jgi:hypothetical protein
VSIKLTSKRRDRHIKVTHIRLHSTSLANDSKATKQGEEGIGGLSGGFCCVLGQTVVDNAVRLLGGSNNAQVVTERGSLQELLCQILQIAMNRDGTQSFRRSKMVRTKDDQARDRIYAYEKKRSQSTAIRMTYLLPLGKGDLSVDVDLGASASDGDLARQTTSLAVDFDACVQELLLRS